jgi:hypothetical protein
MKSYNLSKKGRNLILKRFFVYYWVLISIPLLLTLTIIYFFNFINKPFSNFIKTLIIIFFIMYYLFSFISFIFARNSTIKECKSILFIIKDDSIIYKKKNYPDIKLLKKNIKSLQIEESKIKIFTRNYIKNKYVVYSYFNDYENLKNELILFAKN